VKTYVVGGAIRDRLLGLPTSDFDYVVVGSSPKEMLQKGFRPVGQDFPVFLHPFTNAEYALARTERKTAPGYKGFVFHADESVSLEEDLARRDLTINALAQEIDNDGNLVGPIIDYCGGQEDLKHKIFRHIGPAFSEDPVRLLRLARFSARYPEFEIADETLLMLKEICRSGELATLVKERVWQEFSKGFLSAKPSRMLEALLQCGALHIFFPPLLVGKVFENACLCIDHAAQKNLSLAQRCAALLQSLDVAIIESWVSRWSIPNECRDYAILSSVLFAALSGKSSSKNPELLLKLLDRIDVWRKPKRFDELIEVLNLASCANEELVKAFEAALKVDVAALAKELGQGSGELIKKRVFQARLQAIKDIL
jgi:tRNA nucleotidyltransferase (CCA-adding enzyme)